LKQLITFLLLDEAEQGLDEKKRFGFILKFPNAFFAFN
jgi:hypothetical protein